MWSSDSEEDYYLQLESDLDESDNEWRSEDIYFHFFHSCLSCMDWLVVSAWERAGIYVTFSPPQKILFTARNQHKLQRK